MECDKPSLIDSRDMWKARGKKAEADVGKLRELCEHVCRGVWAHGRDIEFDEWQGKAEALGLLVLVPASEEIAAEYDTDEMFTWAWSDSARAAKDKNE